MGNKASFYKSIYQISVSEVNLSSCNEFPRISKSRQHLLYLLPNFKFISEIHSHITQGSSCNFQLSRDLASSPNGFAFTSIKLWNNLPNSLKSLNEFRVFKRRLKLYLISQYEWFYLDFNRTRILVLYLFTVLDYDIWHILFRMIYIFRGPFWKKVTVIDFHWLSLKASFLQLPRVVICVCFWN